MAEDNRVGRALHMAGTRVEMAVRRARSRIMGVILGGGGGRRVVVGEGLDFEFTKVEGDYPGSRWILVGMLR